MRVIDTDRFSAALRARSIRVSDQRVLISRLSGSLQEKDLREPVNCGGYGRIRHFRITRHQDWSADPLPNLPVAKGLGTEPGALLRAQVFQNGACNWRCWYCFVDFDRLSADERYGRFMSATELVDLFLAEEDRPSVIDLSGGQPDLTPEWGVWMAEELTRRGLQREVFLWSDDNLSNRYFWEVLSDKQRTSIRSYPLYARVGCFKGYNAESFAFNTLAAPELFGRQFEILRDLVREGLDVYAYVTFTSPPQGRVKEAVDIFVDRLQAVHVNLPLRTVPLKIGAFTPTATRLRSAENEAMGFQHVVHAAWVEALAARYSEEDRLKPITEVSLS